MKKKNWVTWIIILGVISLSIFILIKPTASQVDKETAQCIGENSILYIQLGCPACETQEEMFGNNYQYLNVVDCFFDRELCSEISSTPTWIIDNIKYERVRIIEKLKELTDC